MGANKAQANLIVQEICGNLFDSVNLVERALSQSLSGLCLILCQKRVDLRYARFRSK